MEKNVLNTNNSLLNDKLKFYIDTIAKFCDKCGTAYNPSDVHIVSDSSMSAIIHFSCSNCKSRHIATFLKPIGMSSRTPINTDLQVEEIEKFAGRKTVNTNDILSVYKELKKKSVNL